jgi:hypothetical protein
MNALTPARIVAARDHAALILSCHPTSPAAMAAFIRLDEMVAKIEREESVVQRARRLAIERKVTSGYLVAEQKQSENRANTTAKSQANYG